jgi:hypothetical protein
MAIVTNMSYVVPQAYIKHKRVSKNRNPQAQCFPLMEVVAMVQRSQLASRRSFSR